MSQEDRVRPNQPRAARARIRRHPEGGDERGLRSPGSPLGVEPQWNLDEARVLLRKLRGERSNSWTPAEASALQSGISKLEASIAAAAKSEVFPSSSER